MMPVERTTELLAKLIEVRWRIAEAARASRLDNIMPPRRYTFVETSDEFMKRCLGQPVGDGVTDDTAAIQRLIPDWSEWR